MKVYLDHFAATPMRPEAMEAMQRCWRDHGANPDSIHEMGQAARQQLDNSRQEIAELLGARHPSQVVFTSGATESNNWALRFLAQQHKTIWSLPGEHSSLLRTARRVGRLQWLEHDSHLQISTTAEIDGLVAVSLVHSLNGTIQPIANINAAVHCDATAAIGRVPVQAHKLGVASLSGSAHKFGGPHSLGLLYLRNPKRWRPWMEGGRQQEGLRSGTLDTAAIVGTQVALRLALQDMKAEAPRLSQLREHLWNIVLEVFPGAWRTSPADGVAALLSVALPNIHGETAVLWLSNQGVFVSSGSACAHGRGAREMLEALGGSEQYLAGHLRFSLGPQSSPEQLVHLRESLLSLKAHFEHG